MVRTLPALACAGLFAAFVASAQTSPAEATLSKIIADHEQLERQWDPVTAGFEGDKQALRRLPDASPQAAQAHRKALEAMGVEADVLASGCCGMAGAFGFEAAKHDISVAIGERVLLPAVRAADESTIVVADGFSCREQIAQTTDRSALHLAEVVALAYQRADATQSGRAAPGRLGRPEAPLVVARERFDRRRRLRHGR